MPKPGYLRPLESPCLRQSDSNFLLWYHLEQAFIQFCNSDNLARDELTTSVRAHYDAPESITPPHLELMLELYDRMKDYFDARISLYE